MKDCVFLFCQREGKNNRCSVFGKMRLERERGREGDREMNIFKKY
jgi:hypothetical protein